jgi:hypothetical protein
MITVSRGDTSQAAQVRYITLGKGVQCGRAECTAVSPYDFSSVKGELDFPAGVASMSFTLPIVDHGFSSAPKTIFVSLFGPSPLGLESPSKAVLTIINDDPLAPPLTIRQARAHAAAIVKARIHKRPQLRVSCSQVDRLTVRCSISWTSGDSTYTARGTIYNQFRGANVHWKYDFTGTRSRRTCSTAGGGSRCTALRQHFHWRA